jgi:hypothetical protein
MKNDSTTIFLNFVLAALVLLGVIFAMMNMSRTSYLRKAQGPVQKKLQETQAVTLKLQALLNDTAAYNHTVNNPELAQLLQSFQAPQAPAK